MMKLIPAQDFKGHIDRRLEEVKKNIDLTLFFDKFNKIALNVELDKTYVKIDIASIKKAIEVSDEEWTQPIIDFVIEKVEKEFSNSGYYTMRIYGGGLNLYNNEKEVSSLRVYWDKKDVPNNQ